MSEVPAMEVEVVENVKEVDNVKTKNNKRMKEAGKSNFQSRRVKRALLQVTKPSYTLAVGSGNVREVNRRRLRRLLSRLVRRRNWGEASGVLSVLLKGTSKESSPTKNRVKYWASMELLKHMKDDPINSTKIQDVFELWMKRIGSMKQWPVKVRFAVQVEFILFCLGQGNVEDAHQAAICLMQEREFGSDPISNMIVGLTFCQLWYSTIPEEFHVRDSSNSFTPKQTEMLVTRFNIPSENSEGYEAVDMHKADSDTSVRDGKEIAQDVDVGHHREVSMEVDDTPQRETTCQNYPSQGFYMDTSADSGQEKSSFSHHVGDMQYGSILNAQGMDSWIVPLRLLHSSEDLKNFMYLHRETLNGYYKGAVKHLRVALYSTPPVYEALLPLVQMLLLGDHVDEALSELEKFGQHSEIALPLRVKASLLENFDCANFIRLSTCFENILKKDPTCSHALAKLISLHKNGDYSPQHLLEMLALHLDATYPECDAWKEFASCFLKLFVCDEDRMSMCLNGNDINKQGYSTRINRIPAMFTAGESVEDWRLRFRCWLRRHFSRNILRSDIAAGDLNLLTYKAASACHIYGQGFEYVVEVYTILKDKDRDLLSVLQSHMQSSVELYLYLTQNEK